jgi:anti-sigma regulatory factor (Ser/Thr protein kinase)
MAVRMRCGEPPRSGKSSSMSKPPRTESAVFAALPTAPHNARAFTARILDSWKLSHVTDTAALVVSELITNAIKHAGGVLDPPDDLDELLGDVAPVTLRLSVRESLRIEVRDQSDTPPTRRVAADDAESGRGLELVGLLSKEWGCEVLTTGGKIVWAALEIGRG